MTGTTRITPRKIIALAMKIVAPMAQAPPKFTNATRTRPERAGPGGGAEIRQDR
jgi:hypothetical protein